MLNRETCWKCTKKVNGLGGEESSSGCKCYPPLSSKEELEFKAVLDQEWNDNKKVWCWGIQHECPIVEYPREIRFGYENYTAFVNVDSEPPKWCYFKEEQSKEETKNDNDS